MALGSAMLQPPPSLAKSAPLVQLGQPAECALCILTTQRQWVVGSNSKLVKGVQSERQDVGRGQIGQLQTLSTGLAIVVIPEACALRRQSNPATEIDIGPVVAEGGFVPVNDQGDAYKFVYPFGWQEVSVTGQVLSNSSSLCR